MKHTKKSNPLVSIIIPTLNRGHLIEQTLCSVVEQSFCDFECIVVDDGSSDSTSSIMDDICSRDERFYYYSRPAYKPQGGNSCRNYGFEKSSGRYIQWLDSDDILLPNKIETQIHQLTSSDETSIATCKFGYFEDLANKAPLREGIGTYKDFEKGEELLVSFGKLKEYFPPHVYLVPRKIIPKSGLWNENLKINQDGEFFTRLLLFASGVKFVNTGVYYRYIGNNNVSHINNPEKAQQVVESWKIIQNHVQDPSDKKDHPYIQGAKRIMLNRFSQRFPEIVSNNYKFFRSEIPIHRRILIKVR